MYNKIIEKISNIPQKNIKVIDISVHNFNQSGISNHPQTQSLDTIQKNSNKVTRKIK